MADVATRTNLVSLGYSTVGSVITALNKLEQGEGLEDGQLSELKRVVGWLLKEWGIPGEINLNNLEFSLTEI